MRLVRTPTAIAVLTLSAILWTGCAEVGTDGVTGPATEPHLALGQRPDVPAAIAAQNRHSTALLRIPGVVGTAVGLLPNGRAAVRVFLERPDVAGIPAALDGIPVAVTVSGRFMARSDPTTRLRPAPVGFSVGHPSITAGTIGARVRDASGNLYVLSNNHVLANSNGASLGDPALQPGPFDGGSLANDQIATLFAFQAINFSGGSNTIDAAIALSTAAALGSATPLDDGYGTPSSHLFNDANSDGTFDNLAALLGLNVKKYGRTTKLTHGQITGINATVTVCYEVFIFLCLRQATFVDQLIITPGAFSGGGDSGSLIVTEDSNNNPVALLFAGSSTETIANRIDHVLNRFGVIVDDGGAPPAAMNDIAVTNVSDPAAATVGGTVSVVVTVANVGSEAASSTFSLTLRDATDDVVIGTQSIPGLAAGSTVSRTFSWNTTGRSLGNHTLTAIQGLADDNPANDQRSTVVTINSPSTGLHIGDLDGIRSSSGSTWSATVEITVHDASHNPLNGATVVGRWSVTGLNSNTCTSGDLGGIGTCIVLFPSLRKQSVTFTVTSVTMAGHTYQQPNNHDPDGSSNGTAIKVTRP